MIPGPVCCSPVRSAHPPHDRHRCEGDHPLPGEPKEFCGNNNRLLAFHAACVVTPTLPNWMPCGTDSPGAKLPFCDATLPTATRIKDMLGRMTLAQKCAQTDDKMGAVPAIGWHGYNWNTECLHGLGGICLTKGGETRCPSVFAAPPALGATFNLTVPAQLGEVISDEIRAYSNSNGHRSYQNRPIGVSAWGPNLNIYRDPRWGRVSQAAAGFSRSGHALTFSFPPLLLLASRRMLKFLLKIRTTPVNMVSHTPRRCKGALTESTRKRLGRSSITPCIA